MTLEELQEQVDKDLKINDTELDLESLKTPQLHNCLLYTSPSPRDGLLSRMPSSA